MNPTPSLSTLTPGVLPWWMVVNPEMVGEYLALYEDSRKLNRRYRDTADPVYSRAAACIDRNVDELTTRIAAEYEQRNALIRAQAEGGAA